MHSSHGRRRLFSSGISNRACTIYRMQERIIADGAALQATSSHATTFLADNYLYLY